LARFFLRNDCLIAQQGLMEVMSSDSDSRGLLAAAMVQDIDVLVISSSLDEDPQRGCLVLREPRASRHARRRAAGFVEARNHSGRFSRRCKGDLQQE
jgi:hypothetical protein